MTERLSFLKTPKLRGVKVTSRFSLLVPTEDIVLYANDFERIENSKSVFYTTLRLRGTTENDRIFSVISVTICANFLF